MPRGATNSGEPSTTATDTEAASLSTDDVFMLLKNERRRRTLSILREEGETTLSELAERIAAMENDTEPDKLSSGQRKRVYVSLYQCHLPKLAERGVIEFDSSRGDVVRTPAAERLEAYLDRESAGRDGLAVPAVGVAAAVVSLAGIASAPALGSPVVWGGLAAVCLLAVSAAAYTRRT